MIYRIESHFEIWLEGNSRALHLSHSVRPAVGFNRKETEKALPVSNLVNVHLTGDQPRGACNDCRTILHNYLVVSIYIS